MRYSRLFDNSDVCSICLEIAGEADHGTGLARDWYESTLRVGASDRFLTVPSLGALVTGHGLVITRTHQGSVVLYADRERCWGELERVLEETTAGLSTELGVGDFLLFEQGSTSADAYLCSTSHAHLHVVPLRKDALATVERTLSNRCETLGREHLPGACSRAGDFVISVLVRMGRLDSQWFFSSAGSLPSQHMRRMVGAAVGERTWDWRLDPFSETFRRTVDVFVAAQKKASAT